MMVAIAKNTEKKEFLRGKKMEVERGAAALEMAMMVPLVIVLVAIALNAVTYFAHMARVDTMATSAAKYVMDHSSVTPTQANLTQVLKTQFPEFNDSNSNYLLRLKQVSSENEDITYPLYVKNELQHINTSAGYTTYYVTVETVQPWPALGFLFKDSNGQFIASCERICISDKLQDSKWV